MFSRLWLPIQEHIDSINGSMPGVHHYTSLESARGILRSGRIWFTERAHLNDPTEISHGIQIAQSLLHESDKASGAARLAYIAKEVFRNFCFFSASFSFVRDDISQWTRYADGGRGVVLSFKATVFDHPKIFADRLIAGDPIAVGCPISYDLERLRLIMSSIIRCWDGLNIEELIDHIFMIAGMFKADAWKEENEYRFFVRHRHSEISKNPHYKTRFQEGSVIPYLDLPIQGWHSPDDLPIYRVCVGPNAPRDLEARLADFMRVRKIWPHLGIGRSEIA